LVGCGGARGGGFESGPEPDADAARGDAAPACARYRESCADVPCCGAADIVLACRSGVCTDVSEPSVEAAPDAQAPDVVEAPDAPAEADTADVFAVPDTSAPGWDAAAQPACVSQFFDDGCSMVCPKVPSMCGGGAVILCDTGYSPGSPVVGCTEFTTPYDYWCCTGW
jgi:hypothetical protein